MARPPAAPGAEFVDQVEARDGFNIMMNYWWDAVPDFIDTPMATLLHGLLSIRERPEPERMAWRALFDHYLFGPAQDARDHLPDHADDHDAKEHADQAEVQTHIAV